MVYIIIFPHIAVICEDLNFYDILRQYLFNSCHSRTFCPLGSVQLFSDAVIVSSAKLTGDFHFYPLTSISVDICSVSTCYKEFLCESCFKPLRVLTYCFYNAEVVLNNYYQRNYYSQRSVVSKNLLILRRIYPFIQRAEFEKAAVRHTRVGFSAFKYHYCSCKVLNILFIVVE